MKQVGSHTSQAFNSAAVHTDEDTQTQDIFSIIAFSMMSVDGGMITHQPAQGGPANQVTDIHKPEAYLLQ